MVDGILIGLGVLCVAYFIVIVVYAGIGTSFAFIWLFFAALLLFLVYGRWYYSRNMDRIPRWVPVSVVTTCVAGVVALAVLCVLVFLGAASSDKKNLDYVIVLGARVKEHTVSNSLKKRLDKAIEYAEENPDTILVLSGGRGPGEDVSEAEVMRQYLEYNGIRPEQLLIEDRSVSTVENIAYSKVVIEEHRNRDKKELVPLTRRTTSVPYAIAPDKPLEIGVLTSNFHIYRARLTAEKWGIENVYGISADSDPVLFIHLCVRECASIVKDRLMGNM
ncbi:YdcF family protein [Lachnoclostridium pacaense]|uniref:YdcF family protein n=1 Tax=Enterocloster hominis (ex Hitch et al. 2024) TaxID=1917870 RepID=UPI001D10603F|nr:YdcF family protein [Lachnoclostridium pacaense]MCC2877834.1 YdcF family protein [Lachnoclostridium pacaense]